MIVSETMERDGLMSRRPVSVDEIAAIGAASGVIAASFLAFQVLERTQSVIYFFMVSAGFVLGALAFGAIAKTWNAGAQGQVRALVF